MRHCLHYRRIREAKVVLGGRGVSSLLFNFRSVKLDLSAKVDFVLIWINSDFDRKIKIHKSFFVKELA